MAVNVDEVRRLLRGLPEVTEEPHHELASFRVRGRIFATVPDDQHLRLMLEGSQIRALVREEPSSFHEFYWGKRLACVVVELANVRRSQLNFLLIEAWLHKAPPRLARELRTKR